ncbi:hypothetical protein [Cellulomonas sp. PS-H5]|uniref:hypothetical protein n=1 Tax=Cellulomonas sp. PS-H5 TaxID=2820400 RepID=UPI001C4FF85C|nr:hypothetical protein [Cellulomonas sp. PS-H5]MBW0254043.1 hypothetical protein [Cellulomonas sp. PS-H5]
MALHSQFEVMVALLTGTGETDNMVSLVTCTVLWEMVRDADDKLLAASARADSGDDDPAAPNV